MKFKKMRFDVVVVGAGSGLTISSYAASQGLKTALVEEGAFGGTCLNRGCIPSKVLVHTADVMREIEHAKQLGIKASGTPSWSAIQKRCWNEIDTDAKQIKRANKKDSNVTVFDARARFVGKKVLRVGNKSIEGKKVFVCVGSRPFIPPIEGLDKVRYYTSDDVMRLKRRPKSLIIIGGGYIGAELGHFFSAMGTRVTIINQNNLLVANEDAQIAAWYTKHAEKYVRCIHGASATSVSQGKQIKVTYKQKNRTGSVSADALLVATGRRPNSDLIDAKAGSLKVDRKGFIVVDKHLQTSMKGVFAIGDCVPGPMLKHKANYDAQIAVANAFGKKTSISYDTVAHAVFACPQIAAVGLTEKQAKEQNKKYRVGLYEYKNTGMGMALQRDGFVKVLVSSQDKILGCHIVGPHASILIHEVIVAMNLKRGIEGLRDAIHVHPALSEVVQRAFFDAR